MAACLRMARRNRGLTATNPSVGTLLVKSGNIVGRGVTAIGGRPHAERLAIEQAGTSAQGSTAYVTLEPCAHHGATPPCAQALIDAGIARVVTAWTDPDQRVDGKGHAMLREAGIDVTIGMCGEIAELDLCGYLRRKQDGRPHVTLKLAISEDGKLGLPGKEISITGSISGAMVHRMRAENDAILVGSGTAGVDDPQLNCRLPGLAHRSPARFVLDSQASLDANSLLAKTARDTPTHVISSHSPFPSPLARLGVRHFPAEQHNGRLALPEILDDMGASGISSLMVEGGAQVANSFLESNLVDELALFVGGTRIGEDGITSPVHPDTVPDRFLLGRTLKLGEDILFQYTGTS